MRQEAGFRGFGPECLTFDPRYQGVISYLLGRVVIVDDMDHAVRMSKKGGGLRFVTLDGEVITQAAPSPVVNIKIKRQISWIEKQRSRAWKRDHRKKQPEG
ncbi:MAG: hypothetical protein V8R50_05505 [Clostridia bacterium]